LLHSLRGLLFFVVDVSLHWRAPSIPCVFVPVIGLLASPPGFLLRALVQSSRRFPTRGFQAGLVMNVLTGFLPCCAHGLLPLLSLHPPPFFCVLPRSNCFPRWTVSFDLFFSRGKCLTCSRQSRPMIFLPLYPTPLGLLGFGPLVSTSVVFLSSDLLLP